MTVGGGPVVEEEKAEGFTIPPDVKQLGIIAGVISSVILIFPGLPAVIKAVGLILALVWGMDSVRKTSKYGLGTGVPSIGVLAMGYGIVGALVGIALVSKVVSKVGDSVLAPAAALGGVLLMGVVGLVSGVLSNHEKIIGMKIPKLEQGMTELGMAGTLAMLLQFSIVAGSLEFGVVLDKAISNGLIAVMFILSCMAMFHPYNACLGPDERRPRTMIVSVEVSGLLCVILGIVVAAVATTTWGVSGVVDGVLLVIFGAVVWLVCFVKFVRMCFEEAYSTVGTGMIKTIE
ncbi:tetrahydromethanopterin S-methyltransferase subunit C [ANME-1 cluster archaeon ex4572_4]|nr:MAG: tetrahydromethanopterin S-methyltransferase subunit C [ANME-1 cluster archaeon ex4572_4]